MKKYLSLVTFSHTIFAMPFALIGFSLGVISREAFDWWLLLKVILCMVFARNAAMAFNRYIDRDIDAINPRTKQREIPAGTIGANSALWFVIINAILFVATAYSINTLCFYLSPVALLVILGYSLTKRFTALCHFVLGLGLGLAPVGAYLAVTGTFDWIPVVLGFSVLCWVSGFDIIYSLQDDQFDKNQNLHSIPALVGRKKALQLSTLAHVFSGAGIVATVMMMNQAFPQIGWLTFVAGGIFIAMLIYQHLIISERDLSRINIAFMTTNGIASLVFGSLVILDIFIW